MAESWVRLWAGATTDPKWQTIARKSGQPRHLVIAIFAHLMMIANDAAPRGDITDLSIEDVASAMDCDEEQVEAIINAMQGRVISAGRLSGWDARQPIREDATSEGSKPVAQRVREYRQRQDDKRNADVTRSNACNADVTRSNAPDTEADTESDTEADTEADQKQTPAHPAVSEVDARPEKQAAVAAVRFAAAEFLVERGVDRQTASDYLTLRRGKKAASTATALQQIVAEAGKAGLPLQATLDLCCTRGWVGFKAEWVEQPSRAGPRQSIHEQRKNTLDELTGRSREPKKSEPRDISAEVIRIA